MIIPEEFNITSTNSTTPGNPGADPISWAVLLISLAVFVGVCVVLTLIIVLILFIGKAHQNHRRGILSARQSSNNDSRLKNDAKIRLLKSSKQNNVTTAQSGTEDDVTTCSSASDTNTEAHLANSSSSGQPAPKHPKVPACLTQGQPPPVIQNQLMSDLKKLQREKKLTNSSGNDR